MLVCGDSRFIRFAKALFKVFKRAGVPLRFSKFSNRLYTVWQHCVILVLKELEGKSYRGIIELLEDCDRVCAFIGLRCLPHFTTLQKFAQRIKTTVLERVLAGFIRAETRLKKLVLGVDSSGFKLTKASFYYTTVIKRNGGKAVKRIRKYLKTALIVELRKQLIVAQKLRRGPSNDAKDFIPLLKKACKVSPIKLAVGDKGYDSEENHRASREELGVEDTIIPPRNENVPRWKTKGKYRKELKKKGYKKEDYNQRNKNETVFSVMKRLLGEAVTSRKTGMQNKEMILKMIAYNAHRTIRIKIYIKIQRVSTEPAFRKL